MILTYDPNTVYEFQAADKSWHPWQTVLNPPLWNEKLNYRKKPMAHELERKQYEADKLTYSEPWKLWDYNRRGWATMQHEPWWATMQHEPRWDDRVQYRRKPEARPHAHLIKLWAEGHQIEKMNHRDQWLPCPNPCWESTGVYRQKPATQTRFIPIFRMPAGTVYMAEGKITLADCKSNDHDTLISVLEITVDNANNVTLVKEHRCG